MEFVFFFAGVIGLGLGTAALAKRYDRDPLGWGLFGAALFIIALPALLYAGPKTVRGHGDLKDMRRETIQRIEQSPVARVLYRDDAATFDELTAAIDWDESAVADELDWLFDRGMVDVEDDRWVLTVRGELAAAPSGDSPPLPEPSRPRPASPAADPTPSPEERLSSLERLRERGLISNEEYNEKRGDILDTL